MMESREATPESLESRIGYDNMPSPYDFSVHPNSVQHYWKVPVNDVDQDEHDRRVVGGAMELIVGHSIDSPRIEHTRRIELLTKVRQGDEAAHEELALSFQGWVIYFAKRYFREAAHLNLPYEDVVESGMEGMVRSLTTADPDRARDAEAQLNKYVMLGTTQRIIRNMPTEGRLIPVPIAVHKKSKDIAIASAVLEQELWRKPTNEEIAEYCSMIPYRSRRTNLQYEAELQEAAEEVENIKSVTNTRHISLDTIIGKDDNEFLTFAEVHPGEHDTYGSDDPPFHETVKTQQLEALKGVLGELSYRERRILELRYGLGDDHSMTLDEVGRIFKVTRERIRQHEAVALNKLSALDEAQFLHSPDSSLERGRPNGYQDRAYQDLTTVEMILDRAHERPYLAMQLEHMRSDWYRDLKAVRNSRWYRESQDEELVELIDKFQKYDGSDAGKHFARDCQHALSGLVAATALEQKMQGESLADAWQRSNEGLLDFMRTMSPNSADRTHLHFARSFSHVMRAEQRKLSKRRQPSSR